MIGNYLALPCQVCEFHIPGIKEDSVVDTCLPFQYSMQIKDERKVEMQAEVS